MYYVYVKDLDSYGAYDNNNCLILVKDRSKAFSTENSTEIGSFLAKVYDFFKDDTAEIESDESNKKINNDNYADIFISHKALHTIIHALNEQKNLTSYAKGVLESLNNIDNFFDNYPKESHYHTIIE